MDGAKISWSKNPLIITGIILAVLIPLFIVFYYYLQAHPQTAKTRAEDIALALLTEKEVADTTQMGGKLRPTTVQFNDQFEDGPSSIYKFAVTKEILYAPSAGTYLINSLAMFTTKDDAKNFIMDKAKGQELVEVKAPGADNSVAYFTPASVDEGANLTLRFSQSTLAAKIQIYDVDKSIITKDDAQKKLGPILEALVSSQHDHLYTMLVGGRWFSDEPRNKALQHIHHTNYPDPETVPGASYLGSASVTQDEWGGNSRDFDNKLSTGFVSGALARYKIDARPEEAVEVTVLEFDTPENALKFKQGMLTTGVALDPAAHVSELKLPDTLNKTSMAGAQNASVELQSAQGNYVVDVFISSPFDKFDKQAAEKDLVTMSASLLSNFKP